MENINVNVAAQAEINLPKIEGTMQVDVAAMPDEIRAKLFHYGLQQKLSDSCSQLKASDYKEAAEFEAAIRKTLAECVDKLLRGNWREGGGGRTVDPVEAECRATVVTMLVGGGMKKADATARVTKDGWSKIITSLVVAAATKKGLAPDDKKVIDAATKKVADIKAEAAATVAKRAAVSFELDF